MESTDQTRTAQAFNELASHYEETVDEEIQRFWGWSYSEFVDQIIQRVLPDHTHAVLDVATGTGLISRKIANTGHCGNRIIGLDLTFGALDHARQKNSADTAPAPIHWVQASAHTLPFAPGSFDCVICALAAHHINRASFLAGVYRVLQEKGQFVLADVAASPYWKLPGISLLLRLAAFLYFIFKENPARAWVESEAVSNVYTAEDWVDALKQAGFTDIVSTTPAVHRFWAPPAMIITAKKPIPKDTR